MLCIIISRDSSKQPYWILLFYFIVEEVEAWGNKEVSCSRPHLVQHTHSLAILLYRQWIGGKDGSLSQTEIESSFY
jgi:hypothetical protein